MSETPRYGEHTHAGATYGGDQPTGYTGFESPWHFSGVRVDGLEASEPLSPIVPGQEITYNCIFAPQSDPDLNDDHLERYKALRDDLIFAPDVLIYDPPGAQAFYREQHTGPSSLLRVEPLQADHSGEYIDGTSPPTRDSIHNGRWCVPTGGQPGTALHKPNMAILELETVTLASTEHYDTREAAIAGLERNDFS